MADTTTLTGLFKGIADEIRAKDGSTASIVATTFPDRIAALHVAGEATATSSDILEGKTAYNKSSKITGTMPNRGAASSTITAQGGSYTIPAGYHNGSGKVTASISAGAIKSGAGTASSSDPSYDSSSGKFIQTLSGSVASPTVTTSGYVSASVGTKTGNSISGSKSLNVVGVGATVSGTTTKTPNIVRTAKPSSDSWVDASSGAATSTKPTSGPYVRVDAAANTGTLTATPKVTSAGYGTTANYSSSNATATVGASAATTKYIPIATTSASRSANTVSWGTGWITGGSSTVPTGKATTPATTITKNPSITVSGGTISASYTGSQSVTPSVTTGYITSGTVGTITTTGSASVSASSLDSNLTAGNIAKGKTIFGTTGTYTSDANATAADITKGKTAYVNGSKITGTLVSLLGTANTFTQKNTFSYASAVGSSSTEGTITIPNGGLVAAGGIKGNKVYGGVWNDLADLIPIDDECDLEYGRCYCFDGSKYYKSRKYLDDGIIGIHSDTAGFEMGHKEGIKEMKVSVAGFVLAYVDKTYPIGTLLTCTEDGGLTEISKEDKINYPEKIVASFWKEEPNELWGSDAEKVEVNGRKWVKVR